jgi:hypothetical protein
MGRVLQDRRNLLLALTCGTALLLFASTRNSTPPRSIPVPEVSVAQAKALLDAGAIASRTTWSAPSMIARTLL